jgi:outer membrane immunogenic protein
MKRMFGRSALAATLVMLAQAAWGADVGVPSLPNFTPPQLFSYWTGAYLGLNGGWGWTTTSGLDAKGVFGGGQAGYNYQFGNLVFGVEGDGELAHIEQSINGTAFGIPVAATFKDDALASFRGRFGYAIKNVMFYGTGGGAWGHSQLSGNTLAGVALSGKAWQTGWAAGAGIEYAVVPNWSVKLEYLHYELGNTSFAGIQNSGNLDIETVKFGVNYLFH